MTKIGTEVAHVTRDTDTTFKVKRSNVNLQGAGRGYIVAVSRTACLHFIFAVLLPRLFLGINKEKATSLSFDLEPPMHRSESNCTYKYIPCNKQFHPVRSTFLEKWRLKKIVFLPTLEDGHVYRVG